MASQDAEANKELGEQRPCPCRRSNGVRLGNPGAMVTLVRAPAFCPERLEFDTWLEKCPQVLEQCLIAHELKGPKSHLGLLKKGTEVALTSSRKSSSKVPLR